MAKCKLITIVSLDKYQHYKDRHMIWFKWYIDCLQSYNFMALNNDQKWLFIGLICLACKSNNEVRYNIKWLESVLNTIKIEKDVQVLIASGMIALKYTSDSVLILDKKREEEKRKEIRGEITQKLSKGGL